LGAKAASTGQRRPQRDKASYHAQPRRASENLQKVIDNTLVFQKQMMMT
jgi:hypothetical protein